MIVSSSKLKCFASRSRRHVETSLEIGFLLTNSMRKVSSWLSPPPPSPPTPTASHFGSLIGKTIDLAYLGGPQRQMNCHNTNLPSHTHLHTHPPTHTHTHTNTHTRTHTNTHTGTHARWLVVRYTMGTLQSTRMYVC